jgi:2-hydroxychromene-2-carboxylate isomerase
MPPPALEFWFDFASTYSYPAAMRIVNCANEHGVAVGFRPFLLGPIFKQQGWDDSPFNLYAAKGRNMWRDLERLCGDLGLPFQRPEPFPQNSLLAARLALVGLGDTWGESFCRAVFRAEFADGRRIDDAATMTDILGRLGVEAPPALAAAQSDPVKQALRDATEEAGKRGIFGAPSFVTADGELFWGNDRLERAVLWAASTPPSTG